MSSDRSAAFALTAGTLAGFATMALHPTGADVTRDAAAGAANRLAPAVHWLAIVAQPLLLAGFLALTLRLRATSGLAVTAYLCFATASVAALMATTASGFIAPATLRGLDGADAATRALMLAQLRYTWRVNQAFDGVYVVCTGLAILLWSCAARRDGSFPAWWRILGSALGLALAGLTIVGRLRFDVHGFGLVVLLEGLWILVAAWALGRPVRQIVTAA
jgi:hypothetical protein